MSHRGGGRQSDIRRQQPSPAPSQSHPAGRGRGRGRGRGSGRGESSAPSHSQSHAAPPTLAVVPPPTPPPVTTSTPPPPTVESLIPVVERNLTLQSTAPAPSSSKAFRFPDRPDYGRLGSKIKVRANHFQVQVAERDLHHYDVSISPEVISKKLCREVMGSLIKMHQKSILGNRIPAYDGRKSLFTAGPLPFTSKEFVVRLIDEDQQGSSSAPARKKRDREYKVTIRFASKTDIHHLLEFLKRKQLDCPYETIQALDVVLRATPSEKYDVVGRSFFSPELGDVGSLGSGTEYWRGYYQSLRPTQMGLSLNIDVSARAFYEPIFVTDFIDKHFRFNRFRALSDQDRVKVKKALRGVRVDLTNAQGQTTRSYKVTGVTREPLQELMFTLDDNRKTSVVEYFHEKYRIDLKNVILPALQAGNDNKPIYLPMELCRIAPRQRYTKRLNEGQVTALLNATCQRPQQRENNIRQIVRQHNFNTDKSVCDFGIQVREELVLVDARVLPPPRLSYHQTGKESVVQPRMGQWNMIDKKMIGGGTVQYWTCLNFSARLRRGSTPANFCAELLKMCNSKGMV